MKKTRIGLSADEVRIIVLSLVELRNALIQEGRYTEESKEREGKPCQMKTAQPLTLYRPTDIIILTEER